jgi:hypothetical protein
MLRQYYEYFYNNASRQFWRIPEPPAINYEMDGSVVVITGASSGLGLGTAKQILIRATPRMLIDSHTTSHSAELGGSNGKETKTPLPRVVEATCQELHLESV